MVDVLDTATHESSTHRGETPMLEPLQYETRNVLLILNPREGMNWWAWNTALWGMRLSVEDHEMYFEWKFNIISRTFGEIGHGTLSWRRREPVPFIGTKKKIDKVPI